MGAEIALQWCELEEVVEHHLRIGIPAQLHHDAHAIAIAFIADVGNTLELLVVHHLGNALDQRRLVGLVRQFGDDHRITIRPARGLDRLNRRHTTHGHRTATAQVGLTDARATQDLPTSWEVGPGDDPHQLFVIELRVLDESQQSINQFPQVVGGNIGGHAHRNSR